jgi:Tfp pilus assembly protein PilN
LDERLILASIVGLDFVGDRLHIALVDGSSSGASVRGTVSAALPQPLVRANAAELGRWLKDQLAQQRIDAAEAAVSLGRGHSNFRTLQVPDVPPEELPGIVQLTLEGDAGIDGEQVVDFDAGPVEQGQRIVTAAYASATTVETVREMLKVAGLHCKRVVLRPYAMRFLREQMLGSGDSGTELLLIPTADGIDLSIWSGKRLEMARSVSVSGHGDPGAKLSSELRRTLAAYQNNKPGATLTSVAALAGDVDAYAPSVQNALQRTISSADPAKRLQNLPESKATWGAVATAWQTAAAAPPTLNLFNPRKPPPPKYPPRRLALMVGALVVVLFGTIYFWRDSKIRSLDSAIAAVESDAATIDGELKRNKADETKSTEVKTWVNARVDWLDQLKEFAALMPPTDKAIVQSVHGEMGARDVEGKLKVDLRARESSAVQEAMVVMQQLAPRYSVHANGINTKADLVDFKLHESFEVTFIPKGLSLEAVGKSASTRPGSKTANGKESKTASGKESKPTIVYADALPPGKVRTPTGFGMKKPTVSTAVAARPAPTGGAGMRMTVGSPSTTTLKSSDDSHEAEVARLVALPLDDLERELAKKPSLLRNRWRKSVEEAKAKAKSK